MWKDDHEKMKDIVRATGSPYAACIAVAKRSRQLQKEVYNVISEAQSVSWAISGVPPSNLDEKLARRLKEMNEEVQQDDKVENILSSIDEENVRKAVKKSYQASLRSKQILFDYDGIKDKGLRTRIRILTRMLFLS